jgi:hypothetical protein
MQILVLGSGLMGPAAAYNALTDAQVTQVTLADKDADQLAAAAARLKPLIVNPARLQTTVIDLTDQQARGRAYRPARCSGGRAAQRRHSAGRARRGGGAHAMDRLELAGGRRTARTQAAGRGERRAGHPWLWRRTWVNRDHGALYRGKTRPHRRAAHQMRRHPGPTRRPVELSHRLWRQAAAAARVRRAHRRARRAASCPALLRHRDAARGERRRGRGVARRFHALAVGTGRVQGNQARHAENSALARLRCQSDNIARVWGCSA